MDNISPAQTLLVLVSLIPNNNIRYAMLSLVASITVLYGAHLQRPSIRLAQLEHTVDQTKEMIQGAKAMCPRAGHSLAVKEVCLLKVRRSMCILRSTLLQIPGMGWTPERFEDYRQLCRDIYQCEKEVKMIQVAAKITVEAELKRKYTQDIRETEAIVTAVLDPRGQAAMYHQSGVMLEHQILLQHHVFAIATTGPSTRDEPSANTLRICGTPEHYVQRAVLLASSKVLGLITLSKNDGSVWAAVVCDIGVSAYDEQALWDVVRKSAHAPIDPPSPPPGSRGIDRILSDARARLQRLTPRQAYAELREPEVGAPTFLVDIRTPDERVVLEWRFDPRCDERLVIVDRYDLRVIVFCEDGGASSLAALALQELGLLNTTDIVGGYRAWKAVELPVDDLAESTALSVIKILD
ncbi:hypothetical protein C8R44DRAFT_863484 [Mycena epipterygia]|nr:hypothetical protein C8R44DRAFT_863484 [Mycena epipterygia]